MGLELLGVANTLTTRDPRTCADDGLDNFWDVSDMAWAFDTFGVEMTAGRVRALEPFGIWMLKDDFKETFGFDHPLA